MTQHAEGKYKNRQAQSVFCLILLRVSALRGYRGVLVFIEILGKLRIIQQAL